MTSAVLKPLVVTRIVDVPPIYLQPCLICINVIKPMLSGREGGGGGGGVRGILVVKSHANFLMVCVCVCVCVCTCMC